MEAKKIVYGCLLLLVIVVAVLGSNIFMNQKYLSGFISAERAAVVSVLCGQDPSESTTSAILKITCTPQNVLVAADVLQNQFVIHLLQNERDWKVNQVVWLMP